MYIELEPKDRTALLHKAKRKLDGTWEDLAKFLNINRSMIFFYLSGHSRIPSDKFIKLQELTKMKIIEYKTKSRGKEIKTPKKSKELIEFLGILAGDGHMNYVSYEVTVTGHRQLDHNFLVLFVKPLIKKLFGISPYTVEKNNVIYCRVYSKNLVDFLHVKYGVPIGSKKNRLRIPPQFINTHDMKYYLRGLFDTDGSISRHHKNSVSLEISSRTPEFLKDAQNGLILYGFNPYLRGKSLILYRRDEIDKFFRIIKPRNEKHLKRYSIYKKIGYIPKDMRL